MLRKIIILLSISIELVFSCTCPTSNPGTPSQLKPDPSFVLQDVIIDGVNYGKPYNLGNLLFLQGDFSVSPGIYYLTSSCPKGYRLPTEDEYSTLIKILGSDAENKLSNPNGFNIKKNVYYMTTTKTYPDDTNGVQSDAWKFQSLYYSGNSLSIESYSTFFEREKMRGRCVQDISEDSLPVTITEKDLFTNIPTSLTMNTLTVKGHVWRTNGQISTANPFKVIYSNQGCYLIEAWGINLIDKVVYYCKTINVLNSFGNENDSSFDINKVTVEDTGVKTYRVSGLFFSHAQAPVAPRANGGYYMVYTSNPDNTLHLRYTTSSTSTVKEIELKIDGYPIDVIETDYGLAIYAVGAKDSDYSFILGIEKDTFKVRFNKTVMNNGHFPTMITEQITFYSSAEVPLFGMEAMHEPDNGKLAYGKGRLSLIFAHYNNFGAETAHRKDHTGDTLFTFDDNGEDVKYAWAWLTSHSLLQDQIYDGKYFVTASLGDAYPMGIKVCFIDGQTTTSTVDPYWEKRVKHNSWCNEIIKLPGTMSGNSYGRMGGIIYLGDDIYAIIYSIKPTYSERTDIIGMLKFKFSKGVFEDIQKYTLLTGVASSLVNIRAVKYGNKILITYTLNSKSFGTTVPREYNYLSDNMYYLLVRMDGTIANGPIKAKENQMNLSDTLRPMKDGSLLWTYVDSSDNLKIVKVKAP